MAIVFKFRFLTILSIMFSCFSVQAQTNVFGDIDGVEYWDLAGSPYVVIADVNITEGSELIIEPGVRVVFNYTMNMHVRGTLTAIGTEQDSIKLAGPILGSNYGGSIYFYDTSINSNLKYCSIRHMADYNSQYGAGIVIYTSSLVVSHSQVRRCEGSGIIIPEPYQPTITNNIVIFNSGDIIAHPLSVENFNDNYPPYVVFYTEINVTASTTWPNYDNYDVAYQVPDITIEQGNTLTIEPGAKIFMALNADMNIEGTLIADGEPQDTILFRGFHPVTPNDTQHAGEIHFKSNSQNSILDHVRIEKFGETTGNNATAVKVETSSLTISNSYITDSEGSGILVPGNYQPIITNNRVLLNGSWDYFAHPMSVINFKNNYPAYVVLLGEINISSSTTWPAYDNARVGYQVPTITIEQGNTLTIEPGVNIFLGLNADMIVDGTLNAIGTDQDTILFRGFHPSTSGDTQHGGEIKFSSTSENSILDHVRVEKFGESSGNNVSTLVIETSSLTVTNSYITDSEELGIYIPEAVQPIITNNRLIQNNGDFLVHPMSVTNFNDNFPPYVQFLGENNITGSTTWPAYDNYNIIYQVPSMTINQGATLTIEPKVKARFGYKQNLTVNGSLVANGSEQDSIYFYGYDVFDENKSGGTLFFSQTSEASSLNYVVVKKMGEADANGIAIKIDVSDVLIDNSSITGNESIGIYIDSESTPIIQKSRISNQTVGAHIQSGNPSFLCCNFSGNVSYGLFNDGINIIQGGNNWWGALSGPFHPTDNPTGTGSRVSDNVLFSPWLNQSQCIDTNYPYVSINIVNGDSLSAVINDDVGISTVVVKYLTSGLILKINNANVAEGDVIQMANSSVAISANGNAGNEIRMLITDLFGKERVWVYKFF